VLRELRRSWARGGCSLAWPPSRAPPAARPWVCSQFYPEMLRHRPLASLPGSSSFRFAGWLLPASFGAVASVCKETGEWPSPHTEVRRGHRPERALPPLTADSAREVSGEAEQGLLPTWPTAKSFHLHPPPRFDATRMAVVWRRGEAEVPDRGNCTSWERRGGKGETAGPRPRSGKPRREADTAPVEAPPRLEAALGKNLLRFYPGEGSRRRRHRRLRSQEAQDWIAIFSKCPLDWIAIHNRDPNICIYPPTHLQITL
jgi:hypothetical protein